MNSNQRVAALGGLGTLCALLTLGCGQPVREDRAATFSADNRAGFQHGRDGIYIEDPAGGPPLRIYQPTSDVVALSSPLWAPDGKKLIFTTAQRVSGTGSFGQLPAEPQANGAILFQQEVNYTCWIFDPADGEKEPRELFDSHLNHAGYVAANLAVRWTPKGDGVLFLEAEGQVHALHLFDLATDKSRRAFPHSATAFLFDFTADRSHLCCVLGDKNPDVNNGIWIGRLDSTDWWHVPGSESPVPSELGSTLEQLRASRPAWTADGQRFAFLSYQPKPQPEKPGKYLLKIGNLANRSTRTRLEAETPWRDLHWSPDGKRLGCLRGNNQAELQLLDAESGPATTAASSVRTFAGWDPAGKQLAFIAADESPRRQGEKWAMLFTAREDARSSVQVLPGDGKGASRRLIDGWHATFPSWSTDSKKIAVWLTFESPYMFGLGQGGLPPRDPAALIDVATGALHWQPVNVRERAQLAHDRLRRHEYQDAWKLYSEIEDDPALAAAPEISLYIACCLNKLGRTTHAQARIDKYRKSTPQSVSTSWIAANPTPTPEEVGFTRDAIAAEVFLSLDQPEEALAYLRQSLKDAANDEARCRTGIVLAQMLLLLDRKVEYVDLLSETLLPAFLKSWPKVPVERREAFVTWAGITGLPAASPKFLSVIPDAKMRQLLPRCQSRLPQATDDVGKLAIDVLLDATSKRLGNELERRAAEARIQSNPTRSQYLPNGVDAQIESIRQAKLTYIALAEFFGR